MGVALAALAGIAVLYQNASTRVTTVPRVNYEEMRKAEIAASERAVANCKTSLMETLSEDTKGLINAYCGGSKDYDPLKGRTFNFDQHVRSIQSAQEKFPRNCFIELTESGKGFFATSGRPDDFGYTVILISGTGGYFKTYISEHTSYFSEFDTCVKGDKIDDTLRVCSVPYSFNSTQAT